MWAPLCELLKEFSEQEQAQLLGQLKRMALRLGAMTAHERLEPVE
jgi:hypothetical protein